MPEGPQVYRMGERMRDILCDIMLLESLVTYERHPGPQVESSSSSSSDENTTPPPIPSSAGGRGAVTEHRYDGIRSQVSGVRTKGKRAVILLRNGQGILITFAITGKLDYDKMSHPSPTASTMAVMRFSGAGGKTLYITLSDPQHLASATLGSSANIISTMLPLGFDPLHTITGMREWLALCKAHGGQLTAMFITNQSIVAGVGNRYRSEIMHVAHIPPDSRVRDLTLNQLQRLLISIYRVLKLASRDEYTFAVYGRKESLPEGRPVTRAEIAKGVLVWTTAKSVMSARRVGAKTSSRGSELQ